MLKLIGTDLKRTYKDKLFLVVCILGVVFSLMSPLLYKFIAQMGMEGVSGQEADSFNELISSYMSAKKMFFEAFLPSSNFGLIMPVLVSIIVCKDFSFGTIRNKIICGYSRVKIFFSLFFTSAAVICSVMLLHAFLTLGISLIFFDYQTAPVQSGDILYFLISVLLEILVYVFISALVSYLCVSMKNVGLVIVMYVAINFLLTIIDSILLIGTQVLQYEYAERNAYKVMEFLRKINLFSSTSLIGSSTSYTVGEVLYTAIPAVIGSALLIICGILVLRKKDIK